ncbi:MAG: hypothetical protein AB9866_24335 [Syntrophobacteraceae bacterium]
MKNSTRKMSLKPYLEAVREHCSRLSKEELVETMLELAQEAPVRERADFLDKIRAFAPKSTAERKKTGKDFEEALIERIAVLGEEIEERIESIESGSYYEDPLHWDEGGYDEDEPEYVTSEQIEELEDLFLETGGIFLDGRLETACLLYRALFYLLDKNGETAGYLSHESPDLREERARFCRCIYETVDPKKRVQSLLDGINIDSPVNSYRLDLPNERFPMLQDVIDARPGDLPDWEMFLTGWEKKLAHAHGDRAALLRLEAIEKLEGIAGVSKLARKWKSDRQLGYLFWIQCLEKERNWRGMLDVCREALGALPKGHFREQAAEYLTLAATQLGEMESVLLGKRERFLSLPGESNLIELLSEAAKQNARACELDTVIASLEQDRPGKSEQGDLHVKVLLMAGALDKAFDEGRREKSIGWSYGNAGVLFASILLALTGSSPKADLTRTLLHDYACRHDFFDDEEDDLNADGAYEEILIGLSSVKVSQADARKYEDWADKICRARIEGIVGGKHRGAYDRAARALGALTEYYILANQKEKARSLLHEFVSVKFPRHNAFRREVKNVVSGSPLIKDLRVI